MKRVLFLIALFWAFVVPQDVAVAASADPSRLFADMMYRLTWGSSEARVRAKLEANGYICLGSTPIPLDGREGMWLFFEGADFFGRPEVKELEEAILKEYEGKWAFEDYDPTVTLVACMLDGKLIAFEIRFAALMDPFLEMPFRSLLEPYLTLIHPITEPYLKLTDRIKELTSSFSGSPFHRVWFRDRTFVLFTRYYLGSSDTSSLLFAEPTEMLRLRDAMQPPDTSPDKRLEAYKSHVEELVHKANGGTPSDDRKAYRLTQQTRPVVFPWEARWIERRADGKRGEGDFIYAHIENGIPTKTKTDHINAIYGGSGDDIIIAGRGFGFACGSDGNDTYFWRAGDGHLLISDWEIGGQPTGSRGPYKIDENVLLFDEGISPEDIAVSSTARGIAFTYLPTGEQIVADGDPFLTIRFVDGTTWKPEDVLAMLYGAHGS